MKQTKKRSVFNNTIVIVAFVTGLLVVFSACKADGKKPVKPETTTETKSNKLDLSKFDRKWDDMARFLAGLEVDSSSSLYHLFKTKAWQAHAESFNAKWSELQKTRLLPLAEWRDKELLPAYNKDVKTLFYPFGGPDFTFGNQLFPQMTTYIQLGLEPVAPVPDLNTFDQAYLNQYLSHVRGALVTLLSSSYFKTIDMEQDFKPGQLNGVVPVLMLFVARNGNKVLNIEYFTVDDNGYFEEYPDTSLGKAKTEKNDKADKSSKKGTKVVSKESKVNCVKITFTDQYEQELKSLYYFSTDLSDAKFKKHKGLQEFVLSKKPFNALAKAASYLMYRPDFLGVRQFILDNASGILQEDSGMPYSALKEGNKWDIHFYGVYTQPIPLFAVRLQPELQKLFKDTSLTSPLPFGIGYHPDKGTSNLTRAIRKK